MHRVEIELKNGRRHYVGTLEHLLYAYDLVRAIWLNGFPTADVKPEDIHAIHVTSYSR